MKVQLANAARALGIHPCNLLPYLAQVGLQFDQLWPGIDDSMLETVRSQDRDRFHYFESHAFQPTKNVATAPRQARRIGPSAHLVLSKLNRNDFWGTHRIAATGLRHKCSKVSDFRAAVAELRDLGVLLGEPPNGPFSLDPSKKGLVEELLADGQGRG